MSEEEPVKPRARYTPDDPNFERCPDTGYCHHQCVGGCFRVEWCGPLSIAKFPGDTWPEHIREAFGHPTSSVF